MCKKYLATIILLIFCVVGNSQNLYQIYFAHYNTVKENSKVDVSFGFTDDKSEIPVYAIVKGEELKVKISKLKYDIIVDKVKKISALDLIKSEHVFLDAPVTVISIHSFGTSVDFKIQGGVNNDIEHYKDFKEAVKVILEVVNLSMKDLD